MTNPDNVGGLPRQIHRLIECRQLLSDQFSPKYGEQFDGYLDDMQDAIDWMREANHKLCRAAPAGSGEVEDQIREALRGVRDLEDGVTAIAALLRKLQQGADYSFRVLEVGEVILEHDEYVNDYGQWAKVKPPFLGMAYMLNMRTVRRAASQGQEGGANG